MLEVNFEHFLLKRLSNATICVTLHCSVLQSSPFFCISTPTKRWRILLCWLMCHDPSQMALSVLGSKIDTAHIALHASRFLCSLCWNFRVRLQTERFDDSSQHTLQKTTLTVFVLQPQQCLTIAVIQSVVKLNEKSKVHSSYLKCSQKVKTDYCSGLQSSSSNQLAINTDSFQIN